MKAIPLSNGAAIKPGERFTPCLLGPRDPRQMDSVLAKSHAGRPEIQQGEDDLEVNRGPRMLHLSSSPPCLASGLA